MKLEALRRSVLKQGVPHAPYLRQHNGAVWTVTTNGHVIVAVRERLTENTLGPLVTLRRLAHFGTGGQYAELDRLRAFLRKPIKPTKIENAFGSARIEIEPVCVGGIMVHRPLLERALRHLPGGPVRIRAEVGPDPHALRIDDHHFIVICMGLMGPRTGPVFRIPRAA